MRSPAMLRIYPHLLNARGFTFFAMWATGDYVIERSLSPGSRLGGKSRATVAIAVARH